MNDCKYIVLKKYRQSRYHNYTLYQKALDKNMNIKHWTLN